MLVLKWGGNSGACELTAVLAQIQAGVLLDVSYTSYLVNMSTVSKELLKFVRLLSRIYSVILKLKLQLAVTRLIRAYLCCCVTETERLLKIHKF